MMPLPSGLSLFIHLGIIFVAWFLGLFGLSRLYKKETEDARPYVQAARKTVARVLALLILASIGTLMTVFLLIALQTGFREGAQEPHRIFLGNAGTHIKETITTLPQTFQYQAEYRKPSPAVGGPAFAAR